VRSLAAKCGVELVEPPRTGSETACCGYGGLAWNSQPEMIAEATRRRAASLTQPVLASCIMCRDRLVQSGADCLHLLDILPFSRAENPAEAAKTPPPGFSARRANRAALRRGLLRRRFGLETPSSPRRVAISEELLAELEDKHILRDDIEETVAAAEANKLCFLERRSGHLLGAGRPRNVTFWVRYSREENGYRLHDAWCHRMFAPGAGGKAGR
jgi:hypothetical protein